MCLYCAHRAFDARHIGMHLTGGWQVSQHQSLLRYSLRCTICLKLCVEEY